MARRTFAAAFDPRDNALALLRLLLAAAVIWHHTYPIGGFTDGLDPLHRFTGGRVSIGNVAVCAFFAVSGFLVTRSWVSREGAGVVGGGVGSFRLRLSALATFARHRALRILPGFWFALVVMAFALGPLGWLREGNGLVDYPWRGAARFVGNDVFLPIHQSTIAGVLAGVPFGDGAGAVLPGSLWTLIYEAIGYLAVGLLGLAGLLRPSSRVVAPVVLVATVVTTLVLSARGSVVDVPLLEVVVSAETMRFAVAFAGGITLALWADRLPCTPFSGAAASLAVVGSVLWWGWEPWGAALLAYPLLWSATVVPGLRADRFGDLSYGLYVFGFPVQQLVATTSLRGAGPWPFAAVSLLATIPLAWVSWHLVERPALRHKDRRRPSAA